MTDPVDVVLPCLDEAAALPWVLSRIPAGYRAIVADNGSTDGSPGIAAAHGALVVSVPQRGFGYPLEMVVKAARAGWRISEVDVDYAPRTPGGKSKVTGTVRGTLRTVADMSRVLAG